MDSKARSRPMRNILNRLIQDNFEGYSFEVVVFGDKVLLDEDVEHWPTCHVLISFFSTGFPLQKAFEYVKLRHPYCVNSVLLQELLLDRRLVLKVLNAIGVPTPSSFVSQLPGDLPIIDADVVQEIKLLLGIDISPEIFASESRAVQTDSMTITCGNKVMRKPFVEKPVSGEDHNINIYYPDGGRRLFRKIGNKSSEFSECLTKIRNDASYIYEEFMWVENLEDIKVYTIGKDYAHAEPRKSPVVDGIVRRNAEGKEIRYITPLTPFEREIARKIVVAFGQNICGFDLLRVNDKSYVIDVNGWSFVKGNADYYNRCSTVDYMNQKLSARKLFKVPSLKAIERPWELKAFLSVLRHGDRTPKQKMKFSFKTNTFLKLLNDGKDEVVLKKDELELIVKACEKAIKEGMENLDSLRHLLDILKMKSSLLGTKVQIKPVFQKEVEFDAAPIEKSFKSVVKIQLIVKWGGEFTHGGAFHSKDLAENLRKDLLIMQKDLLDDVQVYSSSEGRVIATAEIFSKALLEINGPLPDKFLTVSKEMLDDSNAAKEQLDHVKRKLQMVLSPLPVSESQLTSPSSEVEIADPIALQNQLSALNDLVLSLEGSSSATNNSIDNKDSIDAPTFSLDLSNLLEEMIAILQAMRKLLIQNYQDLDVDSIQPIWCCNENATLFKERWEKLFRDICDVKRCVLEPSKVSELYDSLKYDLLHNRKFIDVIFASDRFLIKQLYIKSKNLFDFIGPREYGMDSREKFEIGQLSASVLINQIVKDLCDAKNSSSPMTRLYFTKESKVICLLNFIMNCGIKTKMSAVSAQSSDTRSNSQTSLNSTVGAVEFYELDYLTQITFELYERNGGECLTEDLKDCKQHEFSLRIAFSPGAHDSNLIDLTFDSRHSISVAPRKFLTDHIKMEDALVFLQPK